MFIFNSVLAILAFIAGAVASIAGFGIGSLLTPMLALKMGGTIAIAVVSISHFFGTSLRFWKLRGHVDRKAFIHFGIMSAIGGLTGAALHRYITSHWIVFILGLVLILSGVMGLSGLSEKLKLTGWKSWLAGSLSGFFGGLVGNQGGIRSAAMLSFDMSKKTYVATATAIALVVDVSRMPVYFFIEKQKLIQLWPLILLLSVSTMAGTIVGARLLSWIPDKVFKRVVSGIVLLLGVFTVIEFFYF